jgi:hypothetical protein
MTTWRVAALLIVLNTTLFVIGMTIGGSNIGPDRPGWLPPVWFRIAAPLAVAGGLWFGHRWAWWIAIAMSAVLILWMGSASLVLAFGGYFTGQGAASRAMHFGLLLGTWLAALALLLSGPDRAVGPPN